MASLTLLSLLFCLNLAFGQNVQIGNATLTPQEYSAIRSLSEKILQKFPEPNTVFVGVGRSPTPVIAYMQTMGHNAVNLPLGGVNQLKITNAAQVHDLSFQLKGHFDQFLKPQFSQGGATPRFVVIDYVSSGKSMAITNQLFENYLKEACPNCTYKMMAFGPDDAVANVKKFSTAMGLNPLNKAEMKSISLTKDASLRAIPEVFQGEVLDQAAEYESYEVHKEDKLVKNQRGGYDKLKSWMQKFQGTGGTKIAKSPINTPPMALKSSDTVCKATTAAQAKSAGGILKPTFGMFSFALNILSFFPTSNPFAKVIGVKCDSAEELRYKILCTGNSTVNPWTREMICTRAENIWTIDEKENVCGVVYKVYEFEIPMSHLSEKFRKMDYFTESGADISESKFLKQLKEDFRVKEVDQYKNQTPPPKDFEGMVDFA